MVSKVLGNVAKNVRKCRFELLGIVVLANVGHSLFKALERKGVSDLRIAPKLNYKRHVDISDQDLQRVAPAAELLSNSTAKAIEFLFEPKNQV